MVSALMLPAQGQEFWTPNMKSHADLEIQTKAATKQVKQAWSWNAA